MTMRVDGRVPARGLGSAIGMAPITQAGLTCEATEGEGGEPVLRVGGELDLSSAPTLTAQIEATFRHPGRLLIDLSELEFCDSTGLRALIGAAQEARVHAVELCIVPPRAPAAMRAIVIAG